MLKKFQIILLVLVFDGVFADTDGAADSFVAGSGATFVETQSEKATTLTFTDANGTTQTASVGDGLKPVLNADGSFKGYVLVSAAHLAKLTDVTGGEPATEPTPLNQPGNATGVEATVTGS